uniref:Olfactory receptor n=1 Tax=Podarcis muralis TaxID=64176 RepID=A0A670IUC0_PODMU
MTAKNQTQVTVFIFSGFTDHPELKAILFITFLAIYTITLGANLGMIILIRMDQQLQTPMYFFLSHLAFLDASYSSAVTPKAIWDLLAERKTISFAGCAAQFYMFDGLVMTEFFLLSVMAYDRYVAICNPLLYYVVMSKKFCTAAVASVYIYGFASSVVQTALTFQLSFCRSNVINHFYCNDPPLLALSCSDTRPKEIHHVTEMIISSLAGFTTIGSLFIIVFSYVFILAAILKIRSAQGRHKAFSTCTSHLTAVTVFYGTLIFTYLRPNTSYSLGRDQVASVFYTVVVPMLNPLIYSLRNKEVKEAFRQSVRMKMFLQ